MIKKIQLQLKRHWAKIVLLLALTAAGWFMWSLYHQVYKPLFFSEPNTPVINSQYAIPTEQIDQALQYLAEKATAQIDFSTTLTQISPVDIGQPIGDQTITTEGILLDEVAP